MTEYILLALTALLSGLAAALSALTLLRESRRGEEDKPGDGEEAEEYGESDMALLEGIRSLLAYGGNEKREDG